MIGYIVLDIFQQINVSKLKNTEIFLMSYVYNKYISVNELDIWFVVTCQCYTMVGVSSLRVRVFRSVKNSLGLQ